MTVARTCSTCLRVIYYPYLWGHRLRVVRAIYPQRLQKSVPKDAWTHIPLNFKSQNSVSLRFRSIQPQQGKYDNR